MRLAFVMPLWKRPALTAIVLRQWHYQILRLRGRVDVRLITVGSEGAKSSLLTAGYSDTISYVEAPNDPLSDKWNKGIAAAQSFDPDGLCIVGSDNVCSDAVFLKWAELLADGQEFFGLRDLYFFDAPTLKLGYWPGYAKDSGRHLEPVGAWRCHSRRIMDQLGWQLWSEHKPRNTVLDRASREYIAALCGGITPTSYLLSECGAKAVDIKAEGNITEWRRLRMAGIRRGTAAVASLADLLAEDGLRDVTQHWRGVAA
jgi:hypothetical protein